MHDWDVDGDPDLDVADTDRGQRRARSVFQAVTTMRTIMDYATERGLRVGLDNVCDDEVVLFTHSRRSFEAIARRFGRPSTEHAAARPSGVTAEIPLIDGVLLIWSAPDVYAKHAWVDPIPQVRYHGRNATITFTDAEGNEHTLPASDGVFNFGTAVENEEGTANVRDARIRWLADGELLPIHRYVTDRPTTVPSPLGPIVIASHPVDASAVEVHDMGPVVIEDRTWPTSAEILDASVPSARLTLHASYVADVQIGDVIRLEIDRGPTLTVFGTFLVLSVVEEHVDHGLAEIDLERFAAGLPRHENGRFPLTFRFVPDAPRQWRVEINDDPVGQPHAYSSRNMTAPERRVRHG